MSAGQSSPHLTTLHETAVIVCIAAGYSLILGLPAWLGRPDVSWQRFLLTNAWMLGAVLLWSRWQPLQPISWRTNPGGRTVLWSLFALVAIALSGTLISVGGRMAPGAVTAFDYLAFTVLGPAAEESFYRGLCLNFLLRRVGSPVIPTALVSVFFIIMHFPAKSEALVLAFVSVGLCVAALRTRSLFWPWFLHSGWNLCVLGWSAPSAPARHLVVTFVAVGLSVAAWLLRRSSRCASVSMPTLV